MRIASSELPVWFTRGAAVVTPTDSLAAVAREQFARDRSQRHLETWERPEIVSFESWIDTCWRDAGYTLSDTPILLSRQQERALWRELIEREHPRLFDVSAAARLAVDAAELVADWQIPMDGEAWLDHADARQFQRWHRLFRNICRENHWVARFDAPRLLRGWIASGRWKPRPAVFVGFVDAPHPSFAALLASLGPTAVRLPLDRIDPPKNTPLRAFKSLEDELDFAARRLRHLFENGNRNSLALFVPDLAKNAALATRILDQVFFPSTAARITGARTSAGEALFRIPQIGLLVDHPLIFGALLLLNLASPRIDHAEAGAILRSPFIAGAETERSARALADIDLRKRRELDVCLRDIEYASRACPIFQSSLRRAAKLLSHTETERSFSEWTEVISDILNALGWPGDAPLSEAEDAIVTLWNARLSVLSSLGLIIPSVSFDRAMAHLRRLLSVPYGRGNWLSPIQVFDAASAEPIQFDAAVVTGLSEETWPPPARLSPLIPVKLQRQCRVPGTTPEAIRDERLRKTRILFESAPNLCATYTEQLSSFARLFVAKKNQDLAIWEGPRPNESFAFRDLEMRPDGQAPPFADTGELLGGTSVIKAQSQCPFQAFAKYRLGARRSDDASFGFDALDRGTFVHKALELVWGRLGSLSELRKLPPDELRALVQESIAEALEKEREQGPLHRLSVDAERERLEEVILDWLAVERARLHDFTVETVEQALKFELPGLSLQLRIDRIDRLKNGNLVLIDYKSGVQKKSNLEGDRPAEPQLLVYAAAAQSPVDGIFFGQLKAREPKAHGFSRAKHFPGTGVAQPDDWSAFVSGNREKVYQLADEFVRGVANVHPTGKPCEFCGLKPLCRIKERGASEEAAEE